MGSESDPGPTPATGCIQEVLVDVPNESPASTVQFMNVLALARRQRTRALVRLLVPVFFTSGQTTTALPPLAFTPWFPSDTIEPKEASHAAPGKVQSSAEALVGTPMTPTATADIANKFLSACFIWSPFRAQLRLEGGKNPVLFPLSNHATRKGRC
jgi:hypothetical protein